MEGILSIPRPLVFSIFSYLRVDEVWTIRFVSKLFLSLCEDYLQEKLTELVLDEQWLHMMSFGRTYHLLGICKSLTSLSIINEGKADIQVMSVLTLISKSSCKLQEFCLKGFNHSVLSRFVPNLSNNLLSVKRLVLENIQCIDWRKMLSSFIEQSYKYRCLQHLTLRLSKFDGLELLTLGDNASSLISLDVSYCTQLKYEYLQYALKRWSRLSTVSLQYVPCVKNSTVQVLKEYCPHLSVLCVQGTSVSVEVLMSLALKGVTVDVLDNQSNTMLVLRHKLLLQI